MVAGSATADGYAVKKAFDRKVARVGEACRQQGLSFIPIAADTLGGWHKVAIEQIKKLGAALARHSSSICEREFHYPWNQTQNLLFNK